MPEHRLTFPASEEAIRELRAGDSVLVDGHIVGIRDRTQVRILDQGVEPPMDLTGAFLLHTAPGVRKLAEGKYEKVCIGTTTSARMVRFTEPLGRDYGVRAICGKGGLPDEAIEPMKRLGMVYFAIVGGAAALETTQIEEIEEVYWEELMPECLWKFRVKDFGPLTVAIDSHGTSLYHDVQEEAKKRLEISMPGSDGFLGVPARSPKPRVQGLTHVIDKGMNLRDIEGLFDTAGAYVDVVKLGWGTSYVTNNLEKKIALYRSFETPVVCGGTLFEAAVARDKLDEYKSWLTENRLAHVEVSDGTIDLPRERKLELIAELAQDFVVLSEVGSKDEEVVFAPYQWVEWMREELDAGAWKVITEGREGGNAGIYRPTGEMRTGLIDEIVHDIDPADIIFEAPLKASQAWFVRKFGPEVNLGNIPPDEVIPLETLRLGLRADTLREVLLGGHPRLSPTDAELEAFSAEGVLRWASEEFGERLCGSACSWQKQSSVLVHMVSELELDVDIVELDTQLFFRESYETRERLVERYGLNLIVPEVITIAEQHKQEGPNLWETNPDRCCHIRKVEPLIEVLEPYDAWVSGIRREQSPSRANARKVERSERYGVWKVQPLADWSEKDVWQYIVRNDIPYNPLHDVGYRSIGCIPCTRPTRPDEEERAGRWAGSDKLECGIHVEQTNT